MGSWGASHLVVAAAVSALAVTPAGAARAAEPAPGSSQVQPEARLVEVDRAPGEATAVVVVEKAAKPRSEDPLWAYPERGLEFYPDGPGKGKGRWTLGGIWMIAPMLTASYRHGLGAGFSLDARFKGIVVYNQLGVGAQWGVQVGPFSLGLTGHVDGFFGTMGAVLVSSQFNSLGWGVLVEPGAKAGLQVTGDAWLTLVYEAYISAYQAQKLGDLVISPGSALYAGSGLQINVEHSPAKTGVIYYGIAAYSTRANFPIWFNVDYSPSFINYLGVQAGYEF